MKTFSFGFKSIPKSILTWNRRDIYFSLSFPQIEVKIDKISKQIGFSFRLELFLKVIMVLLIFLIHGYFVKLNGKEKRISNHKQLTNLFIGSQIFGFVPFSYQNNHNHIIFSSTGCKNENIENGRSYSDDNITVSHCFFSRSSLFAGDGGVIYVNGGTYSMNVSFTMFYNCLAKNGGAIQFVSSNSHLRMICANRCSCGANFGGHFAYLVATQMNQCEYLSVSYCSQTTSGYSPLELNSGYQVVDNTNSSMNNAQRISGISVISPSSFTSIHSTFSNNKVSNGICLQFFTFQGIVSMSYANIVHDNSPQEYGVIYVQGWAQQTMSYCIFQNNQNYLFCVWSGSLEVSHSFIDHSESFSLNTSVSTTNDSFTIRMTYQIQFFNSLHCNADISERTISETQNTVTSEISWIVYSVFSLLFVVLLVFLVFYRSIATNLLARHQLEDSLQYDFG